MASFENRKYLRADISLKVEYETIGPPVHKGTAFCRDISVLGLNLILPDDLMAETLMDLKIHLGESEPPVIAKGMVIWRIKCEYLPRSRKQYYVCGIRFSDMMGSDAVRASEFVRGYLKYRSDEEIKRTIEMNESLGTEK
jgi:hypothetical protein